MSVLVDTSIWSLALRRRPRGVPPEARARHLTGLIEDGQALIIGPIRQELLSGIKVPTQADTLRERLRAFPDLTLETEDYEEAAAFSNLCRARGVQGSGVDFLICAVAARRDLEVFTTDGDFDHIAPIVGVRLHAP